jgi:hypothetical protein
MTCFKCLLERYGKSIALILQFASDPLTCFMILESGKVEVQGYYLYPVERFF